MKEAESTFDPPLNYDEDFGGSWRKDRAAHSLERVFVLTAICQAEDRRVRARLSTTDSQPASSVPSPLPTTTDSAFPSQQPFNYSSAK